MGLDIEQQRPISRDPIKKSNQIRRKMEVLKDLKEKVKERRQRER